jgi:hypothetical protein
MRWRISSQRGRRSTFRSTRATAYATASPRSSCRPRWLVALLLSVPGLQSVSHEIGNVDERWLTVCARCVATSSGSRRSCPARAPSTPSGVDQSEDDVVIDRAVPGGDQHPRLLDQPSRPPRRQQLQPGAVAGDVDRRPRGQPECITQRLRDDDPSNRVDRRLRWVDATSRLPTLRTSRLARDDARAEDPVSASRAELPEPRRTR